MAARSGSSDKGDKATEEASTSTGDEQKQAAAADSAGAGSSSTGGSGSSGTKYLNVSGSVLVYDRDGHTVGVGEWTPEVSLDAVGQAARQREFLLPLSAL